MIDESGYVRIKRCTREFEEYMSLKSVWEEREGLRTRSQLGVEATPAKWVGVRSECSLQNARYALVTYAKEADYNGKPLYCRAIGARAAKMSSADRYRSRFSLMLTPLADYGTPDTRVDNMRIDDPNIRITLEVQEGGSTRFVVSPEAVLLREVDG